MAQITWEAPEFEFKEKRRGWYYAILIAAVIIILVALWQNNFLFAIFLVLGTILLLTLGGEKPKNHIIVITEQKIKIGNVALYSYDELWGFSLKAPSEDVDDGQAGKKFARLWLKPKHRLKAHVHIPVPAERMHDVRSALLKEIPEVEHEETLLEAIIEWMRI